MRLILPPFGRHRAAETYATSEPRAVTPSGRLIHVPMVRGEDAPTLALPRVTVRHSGLLRGEDTALIRPYLLTPEERQERRAQRERRRALILATYGIDAGRRLIHGVEVTA
ncbi:hypothetical protein AB0I10_13220 [Streptomyces sp. NPDC050636]|uniref:hypothetical protein n=1 Tax=Streptomyces sp. NPDC050636 TaxID=3154510 RepID=UPI0034141DBF